MGAPVINVSDGLHEIALAVAASKNLSLDAFPDLLFRQITKVSGDNYWADATAWLLREMRSPSSGSD